MLTDIDRRLSTFSPNHNNNSDLALQKDLHKLSGWEKKWQMNFKHDKCNVISQENGSPHP